LRQLKSKLIRNALELQERDHLHTKAAKWEVFKVAREKAIRAWCKARFLSMKAKRWIMHAKANV
jgi:hypothetical protein